MKTLCRLVLFLLLCCTLARADESLLTAQHLLKEAGFYNGPMDGQMTPDTGEALRRFQLYSQLEPTGTLTPETLAALRQGAAPVVQPPPDAAATLTVPPVGPVPQAPGMPPVPPMAPVPPMGAVPPMGVPPPAPPVAPPVDNLRFRYGPLFVQTPYANASVALQADIVRRAQENLAARGLYRSALDGIPGPTFMEALRRLQMGYRLPVTLRLDVDTLAVLHLLPIPKRSIPPGAVRGIPVNPMTPPGAVRGVQVE